MIQKDQVKKMKQTEKVREILFNIADITSISSDEKRAEPIISSYFEEGAVIDALNSVKITTNSQNGYHFVIDAHIDQIGMIVTDITESGFLKVSNVGGIDIRTLAACDVIINTKSGEYFGVVTSVPPHLSEQDEDCAIETKNIMIDVGMDKEKCQSVISPGDLVSFSYKSVSLANNCVLSASLDNKAGAAVIIRVHQILDERKVKAFVTYLFSSQEELGMRGAKPSLHNCVPDEAIVVDVSFAQAPDVGKEHAKLMGKGPMICISPSIDRKMSDLFISTAKESKIPFQLEVCEGLTGTNADVISVSGGGIKTGLISVPLRNMHTYSEVVCLDDIENTAQLIANYIENKVKENV